MRDLSLQRPGSSLRCMGSLLAVTLRLLSRCDAWPPECVGSVVAAQLSCPVACGILVPQPGIEPASPALEGGFLTTRPPGKSLFDFLIWTHSLLLVPVTDFWSPHEMGATSRKPILCRLSVTHKSGVGTGNMKRKSKKMH